MSELNFGAPPPEPSPDQRARMRERVLKGLGMEQSYERVELIDGEGETIARGQVTVWKRTNDGGAVEWGGTFTPPAGAVLAIDRGRYTLRLGGRDFDVVMSSTPGRFGRGASTNATFTGSGAPPF
jgi:hypothetical protein